MYLAFIDEQTRTVLIKDAVVVSSGAVKCSFRLPTVKGIADTEKIGGAGAYVYVDDRAGIQSRRRYGQI